jgi:hypothetical protein
MLRFHGRHRPGQGHEMKHLFPWGPLSSMTFVADGLYAVRCNTPKKRLLQRRQDHDFKLIGVQFGQLKILILRQSQHKKSEQNFLLLIVLCHANQSIEMIFRLRSRRMMQPSCSIFFFGAHRQHSMLP